jgi:hypothetical protein
VGAALVVDVPLLAVLGLFLLLAVIVTVGASRMGMLGLLALAFGALARPGG